MVTDKQRIAPDLDQFKAAWMAGMTFCSWHHGWVPFAEAHRQVGSPNTVWCCRACIEELDAREHRAAPEARVDLKPVKMPPRVSSLFSLEDE